MVGHSSWQLHHEAWYLDPDLDGAWRRSDEAVDTLRVC
jgi:hypothetical protein